MFNSKFVQQRNHTNKCTLIVKGDWNDADYITESNTFSIEGMNNLLPYFCILLDLFKFDYDFRHKFKYNERIEKYNYKIDIRTDFEEALEFYFKYKKGFLQELMNLKNDEAILSDRIIASDIDDFEVVYEAALANIKEILVEQCYYSLPSYEGWGIHNIKEIYIEDCQGNKYDIQSNKTLEAFAEIMDREFDNFWS